MNNYSQDFIKILEHLKTSKHPHEIFNDWLVMATATLYSWKKDQSVENEYMQVAKQYTKEELEKHSELLALTVYALEKTEQDFLGEIFMNIDLGNSRTGQFFTPYNISSMMAKMAMGENKHPKNRVCKINDCCCGAGGMLIAGAAAMKESGFNYQQNALFFGTDIDGRCARMAFIQLSLLGAPAIITCGNSLTMETYWQKETIGYYLAEMDMRLRVEEMFSTVENIAKEVFVPEFEKEEKIPMGINFSQMNYIQGELF